jgi:hypothetical protein
MTMSTCYLKLCLIWLCLFQIYISIFSLIYFPPLLILLFLFLPIKTLIFFLYLNRGKSFYFSSCSLCSLLCCEVNSDVRNVVISLSFALLFVRACSHTCPECPSMLWAQFITSFFVFCPKGCCFSLVICFIRLTHSVLHVLVFLFSALNFKSSPYILPCFSNFPLWIWFMGFGVVLD